MRDIFLDYNEIYKAYEEKSALLDKLKLYHFEILDDIYHRILEVQPGNDYICLEYMDFEAFNKMVSKNYIFLVNEFHQNISNLEKEVKGLQICFEYQKLFTTYGQIPLSDLVTIFNKFNISCKTILSKNGSTLYILDNGKYIPYLYTKKYISLVNIADGYIEFNPLISSLIGEEFLKFYFNYLYNNGYPNKIDTIYDEYIRISAKNNSCIF